jgi:hypothetical protein
MNAARCLIDAAALALFGSMLFVVGVAAGVLH